MTGSSFFSMRVLRNQLKRCRIWMLFVFIGAVTFTSVRPSLLQNTYAAEKHEIKGFVLSEEGQKIQGATVTIKETGAKTVTDGLGFFKFSLERSGSVTFVATAKGYQTTRKKVQLSGITVNVTLTLKRMAPTTAKESEPELRLQVPKRSVTQESSSAAVPKTRVSRRRPSMKADSAPAVSAAALAPLQQLKREAPHQPSPAPRPAYSSVPLSKPAKIATSSPQSPSSEDAGRDEYSKIQENPYKDPKVEPLSTFSIDVDTASYSNLRRFITSGQLPPVDAVKIEEMINYFTYSYEAPKEGDKHPFSVHTELAEAPWNPEHKLLHVGLQGRRIDSSKLPPSNLVFLLDVSGSMNGPDRLPLLKQALMLLSGTLRPQDKVTIVVYAGAAGVVLPPTPGSQRRKIIEAFSRLQAGGSTAGGAGIKLAYQLAREQFIKGGNNRVILATDGDFNVGVSSQAELVRLIEKERESGVFLTVLGFGRGNYRAQTMSELAEKGNGNHAYIDSILEAQKVLVSEMGGTLFTIAKDVKIQIEFNPAKVGRYRLIGYQSRILAAADFSDDKKDAGELGAGHSVTALYELIPPDVVKTEGGQVDPLKYQTQTSKAGSESDEWLTVKLRYKKPDGDRSTLLTHPLREDRGDWREASEDFRFSAGVAGFGMLLRDSKHLEGEQSSWASIRGLIEGAMGSDDQGYRHELLDLFDRARKLKEK